MKVTALAGGTGSAKLLRGLVAAGADLTVVANVGDNFWIHGLYICPDVDIAVYSLAGIADTARGWGIDGDTFAMLGQLGALGSEAWFSLGDRDMAVHLFRTNLMRAGASLTEVTDKVRARLGVLQDVLPATDGSLETHILTEEGKMHLQEFWVKNRGKPGVLGVSYDGAEGCMPTSRALSAIGGADRIVLCPANPVTSIGPILSIPGVRTALKAAKGKVVGVSPMRGASPFSGPAGKLLQGTGVHPDVAGVVGMYSDFMDAILVDSTDAAAADEVKSLGVEPIIADTEMAGASGEARLAGEVLRA